MCASRCSCSADHRAGAWRTHSRGCLEPPPRGHTGQAPGALARRAATPRPRRRTLWPDLTLDVALPRMHKDAHYARRDLGDRDAVVLRGEVVALFPNATLEVDAVTFEAAADAALAHGPYHRTSAGRP